MTPHELKKIFPNASRSTLQRNLETGGVPPSAEHEQDSVNESLAASPGTHRNPCRCAVVIASYRLRLADEDNLFIKWHLDALVRAGIIRNDDPSSVQVEVRQFEVEWPDMERTEIYITCLP